MPVIVHSLPAMPRFLATMGMSQTAEQSASPITRQTALPVVNLTNEQLVESQMRNFSHKGMVQLGEALLNGDEDALEYLGCNDNYDGRRQGIQGNTHSGVHE